MAMRFEYQPLVAGGLAGLAVGRGKAKSRQRKYNLDLQRDQLRLQSRYGGYGGRRLGTQNRLGQFGQPEAEPGTYSEDPFDAAVAAGDIAGARQIRARRKRGASRSDPTLYSQYEPGRTKDQIEREQELEDEKRRRGQLEADADLAFGRSQIDDFLPPKPEHIAGTDDGRQWDNLNKAESEILGSRDYDENEPETKAALDDIRRKRQELIKRLPPKPDSWEALNDRARVWDPVNGGFVKPGPNQKPDFFIDDKGEPQPWPKSGREEDALAEKEEQETAEQAKLDEFTTEFDKQDVVDENDKPVSVKKRAENARRIIRDRHEAQRLFEGRGPASGEGSRSIIDEIMKTATPVSTTPSEPGPDDLVSPVPAAEDLEVPTGAGPATNPAAQDVDAGIARRRAHDAIRRGELPVGAMELPDGSILFEGQIHRRRSQ